MLGQASRHGLGEVNLRGVGFVAGVTLAAVRGEQPLQRALFLSGSLTACAHQERDEKRTMPSDAVSHVLLTPECV